MRRTLRDLFDRVLGMLPNPRPVFDVGPHQKLTIICEPAAEPTNPEVADRLHRTIEEMRTTFKLNAHAQEWADFIEARVYGKGQP